LAVLQVEDPTFFAGLVPLEFGDVPSLHTTVTTIGYPIGGQRMSITRGVVSRIEYRSYVHSGLDSHLAIQTDAAINPGNSGGPVVQDGKVVGVAFQGIGGGQAQNTGYMIPTPVIQRFLADIQDGRYDGYPELAIGTFNLVNQTVREKLGLPMDSSGLLVTHVQPEGSADGFLKDGDVLMKVDGHPIMSDGQIDLDGERILMVEIVERKFIGDTVLFTVLRGGTTKDVEVPLKGAQFYMYRAHEYDALPRYLVFAGLVFQPLTLDFLQRYQPTEPAVLDAYEFQISDGVYVERPEIVVLSQILADPINTYMGGFQMSVVEEVNGRTIGSMKDLDEALSAPAERYVIKVRGEGVPLVLEADKVAAAQERIAKQYGIPQNKNIGKGTREE
jgi:hypothetical protein